MLWDRKESRQGKHFRVSDSVIGMEDLLGRYREAGDLESSGSFTLDPKKAIEKLSEFQLPTPYHWILKLIQSLHLSGASVIDISAGIHGVQVVSDAAPRFGGVEDLLGHLLADPAHCDPALRHLAAGLQGSLAVRPREVRASFTSDGQTRTFVLKSGGWRAGDTRKEGSGVRRFELELHRNLNERLNSSWFTLNTDIFDLFFRRPGAYDRENAVAHEAVPFANCEVRLKGKIVSRRPFGQPRFPGYDISSDPSPGDRTVPLLKSMLSNIELVAGAADRRHHLVERLVPASSGNGFWLAPNGDATLSNRAALGSLNHGLKRAYALRMELAKLSMLVFIEDGVITESRPIKLGCPGLVALIDASDLRKDITTLKIAESEEYLRLEEELRQVWRELRQEVADNIDRMPARSHLMEQLFRELPRA